MPLPLPDDDAAVRPERCPQPGDGAAHVHDHELVLYDDEGDLARAAAAFLAGALAVGEHAVVVATADHRAAIEVALAERGVDVVDAARAGRYVAVDAGETLAWLMTGGAPHPARFRHLTDELLSGAAHADARPRVYGELVTLLWADGNQAAALALEALWNDVLDRRGFQLLCGYAIAAGDPADGPLSQVRRLHSAVVAEPDGWRRRAPSPGGRTAAHPDRRLQAIAPHVADGLCLTDEQGRVTYLNPAAATLLGAAADDGWGWPLTDRLRSPGAQPQVPVLDDDRSGQARDGWVVDADGSARPVEYVATPLRSPSASAGGDGVPGEWVVVLRDASQRRARRTALHADVEHAATAAMITDALARDQLVLHAQPIVDLATGRLRAHELLVRLDHPLHGLLGPDEFLPTAEACGLATRIDRWVIDRGLALAAAGHAVSLNLSATSLARPELLTHLTRTLADGGIDPSLVTLELTETAMVADDRTARDFGDEIRALGCSIALDDFGTGYNGFAHLKRLPVDLVKIDCEFVADAVASPTSRKIIAGVVALAAAFGIATVAEGVEDEATRSLLVELGVDYGQGFGLGRPEPLTVSAGPQPPAVPPARPRR